MTAQDRGWGDPDSTGFRAKNIVKIVAGGVELNIHKAVAHLFQGFCNELHARGYVLNVNKDDWGYINRDIRGRPGVKSNHSWGLAIDLNSSTNPMTSDGHVISDMPEWVGEVAAKYGLFWGRNYSGQRKDPMHFEFLGTPADVAKYPTSAPLVPKSAEQAIMETDMPTAAQWNNAVFLTEYDMKTGTPVRRTFPNVPRLEQVIGGRCIHLDPNGNAFPVTNNQFEIVFQDLGPA